MALTAARVHKFADELNELKITLESFRDQKEEVLQNAEDADRPNAERIDSLNEQFQVLSDALNDLENCISALEDYS